MTPVVAMDGEIALQPLYSIFEFAIVHASKIEPWASVGLENATGVVWECGSVACQANCSGIPGRALH